MLKRTLAGALCVLLASAVGVWGDRFLKTSTEALLQAACASADTPAQLLSAAQCAVQTWEQRKRPLCALIKHSDADDLSLLFAMLGQAAETGDTAEVASLLRQCRAAVEVILAGERLSWNNILLI